MLLNLLDRFVDKLLRIRRPFERRNGKQLVHRLKGFSAS
jgi:hypothetical protein